MCKKLQKYVVTPIAVFFAIIYVTLAAVLGNKKVIIVLTLVGITLFIHVAYEALNMKSNFDSCKEQLGAWGHEYVEP